MELGMTVKPLEFPQASRFLFHANCNNMAGTQTRELDATLGDNYVMALKLCIAVDLRKIIMFHIL
jgi:hypothetical protein